MDTTYKIILSYRGTNYRGWQFQTENAPTVQETFEQVIEKVINYQNFSLSAASRTDRGVHASHQVIKLTIPKSTEARLLMKGLNDKLPNDIRVLSCEFIDQNFNPNTQVESKIYHYYFTSNKMLNASLSEIIYNYPHELDLIEMRRAAKTFIGTHDFKNFAVSGSKENSTIRTVTSCSIETTTFGPEAQVVYFLKIQAKGYLKYMVRFVMESLFKIGSGELKVEELESHLVSESREKLSKKSPAHGLHLVQIIYANHQIK